MSICRCLCLRSCCCRHRCHPPCRHRHCWGYCYCRLRLCPCCLRLHHCWGRCCCCLSSAPIAPIVALVLLPPFFGAVAVVAVIPPLPYASLSMLPPPLLGPLLLPVSFLMILLSVRFFFFSSPLATAFTDRFIIVLGINDWCFLWCL